MSTLRILVAACLTAAADAQPTLRDICRLETHGQSKLQGLGLVIGLPGTGDSGEDLVIARPLAQALRNLGNPIPDFTELENGESAALVLVTCTIDESGAHAGDLFDATVSVLHSASSIAGGTLMMAPMRGPFPNDPEIWAMAQGLVTVENEAVPTVGRVRQGVQIIKPIRMQPPGDRFAVYLRPPYAGFGAAAAMATEINQQWYQIVDLSQVRPIATAIDDRTVMIDVPPAQRAQIPMFIDDIMSFPAGTVLSKLPEQVICNERTGAIVMTGDVEISPVAITHNDLVITFTVPPPAPTADEPLIERKRWAQLGASDRPSRNAKLQDLMSAFEQLNVPASERIGIIRDLHRTGRLHARLIIED